MTSWRYFKILIEQTKILNNVLELYTTVMGGIWKENIDFFFYRKKSFY